MKKLLLTAIALIVAGTLAYTPALTQETKAAKSASSKATNSKHAKSTHARSKHADDRLVSKKSLAARTAVCKADCLPDNLHENGIGVHGLYRSYSKWDPHLVSPEGRKEYADCVKKCVDPLPAVFVQRPIFAMGLKWFGKTKESCLDCHAKY
jgi:hypothetical protein